ncbi:MAG: GHKL domain-containing protein [Candidatus Marinimicrobia bacterium]|nr:GHKL domain-containing protein [Candidatus Neomarinimicrobiota bacterium]
METYLGSVERSSKQEVLLQNQEFISFDFINELANAANNIFLILNENRQIVFANNKFLEILGLAVKRDILGSRLGEALQCKYSDVMEAGCGTSRFCTACGAMQAIMAALEGRDCENECRILTKTKDAFDLAIKAKPFLFKNSTYVFISAIDISDLKRKEVLERVFFHDILNTAGGLYGLAELLKMNTDPDPESIDIIFNLSDKLIKEIESQRMLINAENGRLQLNEDELYLPQYLEMIQSMVDKNPVIRHVNIEIKEVGEVYLKTDGTLLQRVLINMIKNAAEASQADDRITIKGTVNKNRLSISIHNPAFIDEKVQLQIFQRSFSTKGLGRGIGTYSMKLFGEKYLKGKVYFESSIESGTTFFIDLPYNIKEKE